MTRKVSCAAWLFLAFGLADNANVRADGPFQFYPVNPCRLIDTRVDPGAPLISGPSYSYKITGRCGIPVAARAVFLNVVGISPSAQGFLAAFPYPGPYAISTVNVDAGERAIANGATVMLGTDPTFQLSVAYGTAAGGTCHLVLEIMGYFR